MGSIRFQPNLGKWVKEKHRTIFPDRPTQEIHSFPFPFFPAGWSKNQFKTNFKSSISLFHFIILHLPGGKNVIPTTTDFLFSLLCCYRRNNQKVPRLFSSFHASGQLKSNYQKGICQKMARGNNLELRGAAMSSIKWRLAVPARKWRLRLLDEGCYFLLPPLLPFIQLKGRTPL